MSPPRTVTVPTFDHGPVTVTSLEQRTIRYTRSSTRWSSRTLAPRPS